MKRARRLTRAGDDTRARSAQGGAIVHFTEGDPQAMIASMAHTQNRIRRSDIALAALATVLAGAYMITNVTDDAIAVSWLAVPVFLGASIPLLWRRAAPLAALAATLAATLVHAALFPDAVRCGFLIPALLLLVFPAGARLDRRDSLIGLGLALALGTAVCGLDGPEGAPLAAITFVAPLTAAVWAVGRMVHSRARLVDELAQRTSDLRRTRDERARLEVGADRARLSAQLDELLHRRLGELAALAEGGARAPDSSTTLAVIERESRRTLDQMRAAVGVLRDDEGTVPTAPQPTLTHLEALLVRAKGTHARMTVEGSPRTLPAGVELSAYRVVEHLLDALDDDADVELFVRFDDAALELRVAGPIRRRGEQALERARERVRLHHGRLEAITRGGRTEAVASLPLLVTV
jgi:hypothetical protein